MEKEEQVLGEQLQQPPQQSSNQQTQTSEEQVKDLIEHLSTLVASSEAKLKSFSKNSLVRIMTDSIKFPFDSIKRPVSVEEKEMIEDLRNLFTIKSTLGIIGYLKEKEGKQGDTNASQT